MTTTSDTPAPPAAPVPSLALVDASDTETTKLSGLTQRALHDALAAVDPNEPGPRGFPVQFVRLRSGEMIVLEMRGQSSATGHGKQGLRPARINFLRRLDAAGFAVRFVFVEGVASRREAWLHDLPPASAIALGRDGDPDSERWGWYVGEMERQEGPFRLPARVTQRQRQAPDLFDVDPR
jgi:hypothetical protein